MHRSKVLGGLALASLMLVMLTGCPGIIAAIVGSSESVQQALDQAQAGDTIQVMGTHDEDVTIDKDNITITSDDGASIDGNVTVDANNVTIANITVTGVLDTVPGSFKNLTLSNVTIEGWNATISGTFSCSDIVQPGDLIQTAIGNSGPGKTVCVAPGTYSEDVNLNKGLTLSGLNNPNSSDPATLAGKVEITASDATVSLMKVSPGTVSGYTAAIFVSAGNTQIVDNVIDGMTGDGTGSIKGVHVYSGSGISGVDITDNVIQNISVSSDAKYIGSYGIMIQEELNAVTANGNLIQQITATGTKTWSVGIEVTPDTPGTAPTNIVIIKNTIQGINGGDIGDAAFQVSESTVPADASEITLEMNNFLTALGVVNRDLSNTLIAENNYWGDPSGPSIDGPGTGAGVKGGTDHLGTATGDVDFDPWATSPF